MPSPTRFLHSSSAQLDQAINVTVDSDVVVVLASLLCALICVVGLALVARCAWLRRRPGAQPPPGASAAASSTRGIKKKVLNSMPTSSFAPGSTLSTDCAICLAEFEDGEQIRVLPPCGHGFHVVCIDSWLGSHSSCPSCRRALVATASSTCRKCGATAGAVSSAIDGGSSFLP